MIIHGIHPTSEDFQIYLLIKANFKNGVVAKYSLNYHRIREQT
jgi:hypothetical protein